MTDTSRTTAPGPSRGPVAVLIGPMGSGKTTVGRALARLLGVPFADSDAAIVEADGRTIPVIFEQDGETGFRTVEQRVIARLLTDHRGVLALGGGAVTTGATREALTGHTVILLDVDEDAVGPRIGTGEGRPLLAGGPDPLAAWRERTASRAPLFAACATHTVDTTGHTPDQIARTIADITGTKEQP